jgi:hypothetical protein
LISGSKSMRTVALYICFILPTSFCFAQQEGPGCAKFKTGKFQYLDSNKVVLVNRTKHIQKETYVNTGAKTRSRIRWLSDCTYEIKQVWANSKTKRKTNGSVTKVIITKIYNDHYDYSCACRDSASINKNKGTMYLVK